MKSITIRTLIAGLICCFLTATQAQMQVNNQISGRDGGGSVHYTNNLLPSEMRNESFKSGATRSEATLNARQVGPLSPSGNRAYIPPGQQPARAYNQTPDYSMGSIHNAPQGPHAPINPALTHSSYPNR